MLLTTTITALNNTYTASVQVDFDALETSYATAYGEPYIDVAGNIPYVSSAAPAGAISLNTGLDIGTPFSAGSDKVNPGLGTGGWEMTGYGSAPVNELSLVGHFRGNAGVTTDFTLVGRLDSFTVPLPIGGTETFLNGLYIADGLATGSACMFIGWAAVQGSLVLSAYQRAADNSALTLIASAPAVTDQTGVTFQIARTSGTVVLSYSLDNGTTWNTLGSPITFNPTATAAGLFLNNAKSVSASAATAVWANVALASGGTINTMALGGPNQRLMRSQSPHQLSLSTVTDPQAVGKLQGWIAAIKSRLTAAKVTMMSNPNPALTATASVTQV